MYSSGCCINNLPEGKKRMELKIVIWILKSKEIAKLKTANGPSISLNRGIEECEEAVLG